MQTNIKISEFTVNEPLELFQKSMKPFLKWAGGKSQLIHELKIFIPDSFNKYIEPFLGGGALYFYLNPDHSIISDLNEELVLQSSLKNIQVHIFNKKGEFNVPFGKRNGAFLNKGLLRDASDFLQNANIINADYLEVLSRYAQKGDFIFLDPPYYPVGKYSDFKRYTKEFFYHEDHLKLKNEFERLVNLGCYAMFTNSKIINNKSVYEFSLAA